MDHPIKFGTGEWTCVTEVLTGTFTKPMPGPDGKEIPPTGRSFKINMVTVGQWKNGKMIAESFFWDNLEFMKQNGSYQVSFRRSVWISPSRLPASKGIPTCERTRDMSSRKKIAISKNGPNIVSVDIPLAFQTIRTNKKGESTE